MRARLSTFAGLLVAAGASAAIAAAPVAAADPPPAQLRGHRRSAVDGGAERPNAPRPGNVQIDSTPPDTGAGMFPWDDEFYGALIGVRLGSSDRSSVSGPQIRFPFHSRPLALAFGTACLRRRIAAFAIAVRGCVDTGPNTTQCSDQRQHRDRHVPAVQRFNN